jgi:ribosomal protein S5
VVRAAFTALQELKDPQKLMRLRGKDSLAELSGGRAAS